MINKKKTVSSAAAIVMSLFIVLFSGLSVSAESRWDELNIDASSTENRVFDLADIYSDADEKKLNEEINKISVLTGWDIGIVTHKLGVTEKEIEALADDIYDYCGFGADTSDFSGAIFVLDMNSRKYCVSTCGTAIKGVNDTQINNIYDDISENLADKDYVGSAYAYIDGLEKSYLTGNLTKNTDSQGFVLDSQGNRYIADGHGFDKDGNIKHTSFFGKWLSGLKVTWLPTLIVLVLVIVGFLLGVRKNYKKFGQSNSTANEAIQRLSLRNRSDKLIDKKLVVTKIQTNSNSSSSSGRSSSSGSSTHTSSSGRTHGGGGGRSF